MTSYVVIILRAYDAGAAPWWVLKSGLRRRPRDWNAMAV
jgi:hypothetical protein